MPGVVVVGSINVDLVATTARFPGPGETVPGTDFQRFAGGKGANQAMSAARMGGAPRLIGAVGDDPFGVEMRAGLAAGGVDVSAVRTVAGTPTGTAVITIAQAENMIIVIPGANGTVSPDDVAGARLEPGDVVLTQFEVPTATVEATLKRARAAGAIAALNAVPVIDAAKGLLPLVDLLIVNEHELALLSGETVDAGRPSSVIAAARAITAGGTGLVLVTLGRAGAMAISAREVEHVAGHEVTAVDTTGAGDCFCGAFAASRAAGLSIGDALKRANAAAALSVTRHGATPSMPTAAEVDAFLKLKGLFG